MKREVRVKGEVDGGEGGKEILLMRDLGGGEKIATVGKDGYVKVFSSFSIFFCVCMYVRVCICVLLTVSFLNIPLLIYYI